MTNIHNPIRPASAPKLKSGDDVFIVSTDDGSWYAMYVRGLLVRQGERIEPEWFLGFAGIKFGSVTLSEVSDFENWSHQAPPKISLLTGYRTDTDHRNP